MKMRLKDGKQKVLTLSYDDGIVQDIRLIEIMNKYGLKGTFNINTGLYLPEDSVREKFYGRMVMSISGMLQILKYTIMLKHMKDCKRALIKRLYTIHQALMFGLK